MSGFSIGLSEDGQILARGRLDHFHSARAAAFLADIDDSRVVDFRELEYISSAGLGVLLQAQKRLQTGGHRLTIVNPTHHIRDVFRYAGLSRFFDMD